MITIDDNKLNALADRIVVELDEKARDVDQYEYGLPLYNGGKDKFMKLVKDMILEMSNK